MSASETTGEGAPETYVTFMLGEDEHGVAVSRLHEIATLETITRIPAVPSWLLGVMNLRGMVLPVIDLSARLGFAPYNVSKRACLLVVALPVGGEMATLGLLVDAVRRVVDVRAGDAVPPPSLGLSISPQFVTGLVKTDDRFIVLLDIERVFAPDELAALLGDPALASRKVAAAPAVPAASPPDSPSPPSVPPNRKSDEEILAAAQGSEIMLFDD